MRTTKRTRSAQRPKTAAGRKNRRPLLDNQLTFIVTGFGRVAILWRDNVIAYLESSGDTVESDQVLCALASTIAKDTGGKFRPYPFR